MMSAYKPMFPLHYCAGFVLVNSKITLQVVADTQSCFLRWLARFQEASYTLTWPFVVTPQWFVAKF